MWISPNDWSGAGGSRYGNVAFELDFRALIEGKRYYWVGAMPYKPFACRILLTEQNRSETLLPYDPTQGDGPWWHDLDTDTHYWNGDYCLEFMVEEEVPLSRVSRLEFVRHNAKRCSISPSSCPDRGHDGPQGAARYLSGACSRRLLARQPSLWVTEGGVPKTALLDAWERLRGRVSSKAENWGGPVVAGANEAPALARAVMGAFCDMSEGDRIALLRLFDSRESAVEACAAVIEKDLDLESMTLEREDDD